MFTIVPKILIPAFPECCNPFFINLSIQVLHLSSDFHFSLDSKKEQVFLIRVNGVLALPASITVLQLSQLPPTWKLSFFFFCSADKKLTIVVWSGCLVERTNQVLERPFPHVTSFHRKSVRFILPYSAKSCGHLLIH